MRLDSEFAAVVSTDAYQIFLTPEGDCKGLYVTSKTPTGFAVRELQGGTASVAFGYRVVARQKDLDDADARQPADAAARPEADPPGRRTRAARLEKVQLPKPPDSKDLPKPIDPNERQDLPKPPDEAGSPEGTPAPASPVPR